MTAEELAGYLAEAGEGDAAATDFVGNELSTLKKIDRLWIPVVIKATESEAYQQDSYLLIGCGEFLLKFYSEWDGLSDLAIKALNAAPGLSALEFAYQVAAKRKWDISLEFAKAAVANFEKISPIWRGITWVDGHARELVKKSRRMIQNSQQAK